MPRWTDAVKFYPDDPGGRAGKGGNDLNARVTEFCKDILAKAEPVALPENMAQEMDSIVKRADTNLQ